LLAADALLDWGSCIWAFVSFDYFGSLAYFNFRFGSSFYFRLLLLLPSIGLLIWKLNGFLVWSGVDCIFQKMGRRVGGDL